MLHLLTQEVSKDGTEYQLTLYDDSDNSIKVKKVLVSSVSKDPGLKPTK